MKGIQSPASHPIPLIRNLKSTIRNRKPCCLLLLKSFSDRCDIVSAMGELSESLKRISLGSILVVVGVISILTLGIYWYVFSEEPSSLSHINSDRALSSPGIKRNPITGDLPGEPVKRGPDERTVIVETPSAVGGSAASMNNGSSDIPGGEAASSQHASQADTSIKTGNLYIPVGAFSKAAGAEKIADDLNNKGFSYLIINYLNIFIFLLFYLFIV